MLSPPPNFLTNSTFHSAMLKTSPGTSTGHHHNQQSQASSPMAGENGSGVGGKWMAQNNVNTHHFANASGVGSGQLNSNSLGGWGRDHQQQHQQQQQQHVQLQQQQPQQNLGHHHQMSMSMNAMGAHHPHHYHHHHQDALSSKLMLASMAAQHHHHHQNIPTSCLGPNAFLPLAAAAATTAVSAGNASQPSPGGFNHQNDSAAATARLIADYRLGPGSTGQIF